MKQALTILVGIAVLLLLLIRWSSTSRATAADAELAKLRHERAQLQQQLAASEAKLAARVSSLSATAPAAAATPSSSEDLLALHSHWDWKAIAHEMLQPFAYIDEAMLQNGVRACYENGTMYCSRIRIRNNRLYITDYRAIFFDRHYAPARIMPMLDVLRRHKIPDVDLVVAAVDEPRIKTLVDEREWTRTVLKYAGTLRCTGGFRNPYTGQLETQQTPATAHKHLLQAPPQGVRRFFGGGGNGNAGTSSLPPPLFSSTVDRAHFDLAWPDFSFYMPRRPHKLRTPPWSKLHPQMIKQSASVQWKDKIELAVHTGNVGSSYRKKLAAEAQRSPNEILVNELFIGDHGKIRSTCKELGLDRKGGFQQHKCFMKFEDQCGYKYLLNSASIGYANKFKSLLLCGSVVIYVREGMRHKEFYEYGLISGVHYVSVDKASDIPSMVQWLKQHDDYARAVALAGRARMATLDIVGLTDFMAEVLTQYANRQDYRPRVQAGAVRMECEDDLWRHYALSKPWAAAYMMEDNATCVHPPKPNEVLGPPGWGGSYAGSKPRCYASHDLGPKAQPKACDFNRPFSTSESFVPYGEFPRPHPRDPEQWMTA